MYMLTGYVVVLEHDIGLLAVAECLHILLGNLHKKFIREFLIRMRIERTMKHRLFCSALLRDKCLHIGKYFCQDRKSTRLNSSHANISYAVFCLKKKKKHTHSC